MIPMPLTAEGAEVSNYGPMMKSTPTIFIQVLNVNPYSEEILNQLFRFSAEIFITLMAAIYCFARVLSKTEGGMDKQGSKAVTLYEGIWGMIEMLINQTQISPVSSAGRVLVFMTSLGVFFWSQIWVGEMKTDLTGYDISPVASSFDDLLHMQKAYIMASTDPCERLVEDQAISYPDSTLGQIWSKATIFRPQNGSQTSGPNFDPTEVKKWIPKKDLAIHMTFITSEALFRFLDTVMCVWTPYQYMIGREKILENPQSPWYSKTLSQEYRRILDHRYTRMRESGLFEVFLQKIIDMIPQMVRQTVGPDVDLRCTFTTISQVIKKENDKIPLSVYLRMTQMHRTFALLAISLAAISTVLMLEMMGVFAAVSSRYRVLDRKIHVRGIWLRLVFKRKAQKALLVIRTWKFLTKERETMRRKRRVIDDQMFNRIMS